MFKIYRRSRSPDIPTPDKIYPASLALLGQGYALWRPEPHITGEPQIGDVGYVSEGAFVRLFNINNTTPEHQVSFWDTQFEIVPTLPPNVFRIDQRHDSIGPGPFCSHGVQEKETRGSISVAAFADTAAGLSAGYTCKDVQGALLVFQSHVTSETVFESEELKRYMVRQHEHWCSYVKDVIKLGVRPEDVVLVSGWGKSSADWAATVFSNTSKKYHASVQGQVGKLVGLEFFRSRTRTQSGPRVHRQGKKYPRPEGTPLTELERNQCMFVRRYRLKKRLKILYKIVASAGYDRLPKGGDEGNTGGGTKASDDEFGDDEPYDAISSSYESVDPLDILLEYILEVCGASYAIARDEDIESIVGYNEWPIDFSTYLRKVQPPVQVQDEYGSVSIPDLIAQERATLERRLVTSLDLLKWPRLSHEDCGVFDTAKAKFPWGPPSRRFADEKWTYLKFQDRSRPTRHVSAVSHDGALLAASWRSGSITIWRTMDGLTLQHLGDSSPPLSAGTSNVHEYPPDAITAVGFSANDQHLVSGSADASVVVWNVQSGERVFAMSGHGARVSDVTYTPDGSRIVSVSDDGSIKVWDAGSGWSIYTYALGERISRIVFSADGSRFAAKMHRAVAIYDAGSIIVQLTVFQSDTGAILDVALSPDGKRTAVLDNNGAARIYRTDTWEELIELQEHSDQVKSCAFAPDGIEIATGSYDGTLTGRNSWTGEMYRKETIGSCGTAISYSPNGAFLAAAGRYGEVIIWGPKARQFVVKFQTSVQYLSGLKWLPDNRRLLSYADEGPLHLWNVGDALRMRSGEQES